MTVDEILRAFETADEPPEAALRAAVDEAEEIATLVSGLLLKADEGVFLLPGQQNIVFFGLYALAAARETSAFGALTDFLHRPEHDLEALFGDALTNDLSSLLTSLYDGDADALYDLLDPEVDGFVQWGVLKALAYLVWDSRLPRDEFVGVLRRFGEATPALDDAAWHGWRDAISYLGAQELKQRAIDTWEVDDTPGNREIDKQGWIDDFTPGMSEQKFDYDHIRPIADPVAALSWVAKRTPPVMSPDDPGRATALNAEELAWLAGLLDSSQAPETAMNMEMLDGYFCALVVGPEVVPPSRWMVHVWDPDGVEAIEYDSQEQMEYAVGLLMRHWNTIASRLAETFPHAPYFASRGDWLGMDWSVGFSIGIAEAPNAWEKLARDETVAEAVACVMHLCAEEFDPDFNPDTDELSIEERAELAGVIPGALALIHAKRIPRKPFRREAKVGRNDPCPCGSGRKFKACCLGKESELPN